jgi:peptidoglycan L-alanyl-D-glutamate endopeptidase CwlK
MPRYSVSSKRKLRTCHPYLQLIFNQIIKEFDCTIICGHRGKVAQSLAFYNRKSKLKWPLSQHNYLFRNKPYSLAVDVGPYDMKMGGIDWNDTKRICMFAGRVMQKASDLGIKLRWGGDWDQDTETKDNKFNDLVHFELVLNREEL